jgi:hypothetical protein
MAWEGRKDMKRQNLWRGLCIVAASLLVGGAGAGAAEQQEPAFGGAAAEIAERIAAAFPKVSGQVIGLERERVLVDLGAKDQVIPGLELQVYREGEDFKHPYTGQVLGRLDRDVARIRILEVQPGFSVAEAIQQAEGTLVQQGDKVRVTSARIVVALPNVDVADVAGTNTRSVTRDLTNALIKTNRFEVMTDQRVRAALAEQKLANPDQFADPEVLQALWKSLRVTAVLVAKLSLHEQSVRWDVQVLSTVRGDTITLASADVKGSLPTVARSSARGGGGSFAGGEAPRIDQIALRSQELPYKAQVMTMGEFTGDGTLKLAVTDGQTLYIYDLTKTGITLRTTVPGLTTDNIIALDAADINGNGVAEIFATVRPRSEFGSGGLRSFVLEYQNGKFVKTWDNVPLYFRVLDGADGKPHLYAQGAGATLPFDGPVREYVWQTNKYVPQAPVPLPKGFNTIFGFGLADLDGDGLPKVLILDKQDYLRVFDRAGSELYRSSDHYGGSELVLPYDPERIRGSAGNPQSGIQLSEIMLQGRMYYQDIMGNGKKQLVVPRNTPSTGYFFQTRLYDKGKIYGLTWDGIGMQVAWETREVSGYIADYALVDPEGTGDRKLVLLVVQTNLVGMGTSRSSVVLLDLKPQG